MENNASGKLTLCDRCVRGVLSRGEPLAKEDAPEFDDEGLATCDWCGESFERGEIYEYAHAKARTREAIMVVPLKRPVREFNDEEENLRESPLRESSLSSYMERIGKTLERVDSLAGIDKEMATLCISAWAKKYDDTMEDPTDFFAELWRNNRGKAQTPSGRKPGAKEASALAEMLSEYDALATEQDQAKDAEITEWWKDHYQEAIDFVDSLGDDAAYLVYDDEDEEAIAAFNDQTGKHKALDVIHILGLDEFKALMAGDKDALNESYGMMPQGEYSCDDANEERSATRMREATRVVPLKKSDQAGAVAEAPGDFLDRLDVKEAFREAVKAALPGIFGNESIGPQAIERRGKALVAYPDGDENEAHVVSLRTSQGRHWVEVSFSMAPYGEDLSTDGKSPSKENDQFPEDGSGYLAGLISSTYSKMERVIERAYDGLSETDGQEDDFFEYKTLGRKGQLKLRDFEVGDSARYTFLSADPDFGPGLYDRLKAHLGKIARVVYVGYPGPESMTIRFKDGFTFEAFPDEVEKANGYPTR